MRGKPLIDALESLKDNGISWPQPEDTKFDRFCYKLQKLVEVNIPRTDVKYSEEHGVFFVDLYVNRYPARFSSSLPNFKLQRYVTIDPNLPLKQQVVSLIQVHTALHALADRLMAEIQLVPELDENAKGTKITKLTDALQKQVRCHTSLQESMRCEACIKEAEAPDTAKRPYVCQVFKGNLAVYLCLCNETRTVS